MKSRININIPIQFSIYFVIISSFLVLQFCQSVQSVPLSKLCGKYGHSCLGGNWGKRESPIELFTDLRRSNGNDIFHDKIKVSSTIEDNFLNYLDNLRLILYQQTLRDLLELD